MVRGVATANTRLNQASGELTKWKAFVNSRAPKRLEAVNAAENRIRILKGQLPGVRTQVVNLNAQLEAFKVFGNQITKLHEKGELVISVTAPIKE